MKLGNQDESRSGSHRASSTSSALHIAMPPFISAITQFSSMLEVLHLLSA